LLRSVLDEVAPHVRLITETNVPHEQNISYFGDGTNEAQLVYNFALPPLVLHTLYTSDAGVLTSWAAGLRLPSDKVTFFNFLASHDGIGLNPVRGLLPDSAIDQMVQRVLNSGGFVSYKQNADGSQSPYELNINYFDALSDQNDGEQIERQIGRFMAAQAILLSLLGMPGIYFHSLFGSRGWPQGVALTGMNRSINRQKLNKADLERDLADESSLRRKVFNRYSQLLRVRGSLPAFDPHGEQFVLEMDPAIFAVLRKSGSQQVLCLQNVSAISQPVSLISHSVDLLTGLPKDADFTLTAYQTCWLSMPEDVVFSLYEGLDRK
jgi:sucrose phosphorylase